MKTLITLSLIVLSATSAAAQNLTAAQKEADFRYLASLYNTYYAPLDWKKQAVGFDALDIKPWLDRVAKTTTDLDFYELCVEYVSRLQDTHDTFQLPSDFVARLGFTTDVYDGVLLIDSINRTQLPLRDYPFGFGDQLISIDGIEVEQLLRDLAVYAAQSNPSATRRIAAARLTIRPQAVIPRAAELGANATVVIKRLDGNTETYTIPWSKTGTPLEVGPVPSPKRTTSRKKAADAEPDYMQPLRELQYSGVAAGEDTGLNGYGARNPIFLGGLGANFTRRLGGNANDFFYSGVFRTEGLTIGYVRIPNYSPPSQPVALAQLDAEIAFMKANTDGLIVDEMRNTGGNLCFGENVATRLIPHQFRGTGFALRAFWTRTLGFYSALVNAKNSNAKPEIILQYEALYNAMLEANREGRVVTASLPLCTSSLMRDPFMDRDGNVLAYDKPMMMIIDEFSTSTADSVASMFQDASRGLMYGMRTNGAGGNNTGFDAGVYSEGFTGMTLALQTRKGPVQIPGYPTSDILENTGVHPDIVDDYMTKENLIQNGAPFIGSFLRTMAGYIREQRGQ
jgi:hypothetical protein